MAATLKLLTLYYIKTILDIHQLWTVVKATSEERKREREREREVEGKGERETEYEKAAEMADSSSHPATTPTSVHFPEGVKQDERPKPRQQPTQKYDRKEIQKRLDVENWMEEQLSQLYEVR